MINRSYFSEQLTKLGYEFKEDNLSFFDLFYDELIAWNTHTNLTRITEEKEFIDKHLLDSLSCKKAFEFLPDDYANGELKCIDIGTGAGFPLLPLWFFYPQWKISLLDSVKKKLDFIEHFSKLAIQKYDFLKAENIEIVHLRAEDATNSLKFRDQYDLIFGRAVSKLASLIELSMPFVKEGGFFIAMKRIDIDDELNEAERIIKLTNGEIVKVIKFELLDTGLERSLVIIKKLKKTPKIFPRRTSLAQKQPMI